MNPSARIALLLTAFALLVSCGSENDKVNNTSTNNRTANNGTTAKVDMGAGDSGGEGEGDAGETDAGNVTFGACPEGIASGKTFDLDAGGNAGQFYARTAWDGRGAWVVYNRRESTESGAPEEIFALRVGCKGDVEVAPFRLSGAGGARNYSPIIASRGGITQVVWVEDVGGSSKTILLAQLRDDGTTVFDAPADVTPRDSTGAPISSLTWEPDLGVAADGSGIVAVSAGIDANLQIALQRFDSDGQRTGNAFIPFSEAGVDQKRPTIALDPAGTTYVAWTRYRAADDQAGIPEEPETIVMTSIPAGATMALPATPVPARPLSSPNPIGRFAREPMPDGTFLLAFQVAAASGADILVRNGSDVQAAATAAFGSAGFVNSRPSIAAGESGGLVVWYRYQSSPTQGTVVLHPFKYDGSVVPGAEQVLDTAANGIPPYGPDATWAGNSAYFITWSEGSSAPEARVKGRWVAIP